MTKSPEVIEDWINRINEEGVNLSKWEEDFVDSITDQWNARKSISAKQEDILERIYTDKVP